MFRLPSHPTYYVRLHLSDDLNPVWGVHCFLNNIVESNLHSANWDADRDGTCLGEAKT